MVQVDAYREVGKEEAAARLEDQLTLIHSKFQVNTLSYIPRGVLILEGLLKGSDINLVLMIHCQKILFYYYYFILVFTMYIYLLF